jgi:multidrug efflux pump
MISPETFVRRPIGTTLLALGLMLTGLVAFYLLPVAPLPQVDFPTINVEAHLPGASADTMASSVATPLERAFSNINGVSEMTSSSSLGVTQVTLQFDLSVDINAAAQDVQSAISSAQGLLPKNLPSPPTYFKSNPADSPIVALAIVSDTLPMTDLGRFVEDFVMTQLAQIPGVGFIDFHGQQRPAVRVRLDPDKVAALGLTLEDVRAVIGRETVNAPKGALDGKHQTVVLNATDQIMSAEGYNGLVVAYRNGAPVRVRDVGVALDASEDTRQAAWLDGRPATIIDVHKQPGFNVVNTVAQVRARLPAIEAALPPAARLLVVSDRTQTIRTSVHDVEFTMMLTVALVVMVIFLFLRNVRATLVPSLAIPLSLVGTFGVMYLVGYSLDNLSLMALTIAVGFVIDDAIVVVENVYRHLERGEPHVEAAINGAREVGSTIVSMTLSLIAVFLPILLMGGIVGRLFREFAVTVSVAVLISGFVSLTVTPMACALLLRDAGREEHGPLFRWSDHLFEALLAAYARSLDAVLRHPAVTLAVTVATLVLAVVLYAVAPKGFFPPVDTGVIDGFAQAAADVSFEEMSDRMQAVGRIVSQDPDVANAYYWIGSTLSRGRMLVNLKPSEERKARAPEIVARIKRKAERLPGITLGLQVRQDIRVGGRIAASQYQYTLQDADVDELNRWADTMLNAFRTVPQLRDVESDAQAAATSATLRIDRDTAARLGVAAQAIDDVLYDAFGQRQVATLFTQLNQYRVIQELDPRYQLTDEALRHLYVRSTLTNALVPLSMVASVERGVSPVSITHQSLFPSVTLSFNLAPGVALGDAVEAIHALEARIGKPDSVLGSLQGTARAFEASLRTQPWLILAAVLVVYIVLGVLYESAVHPMTIISSLPSAGIGALLALTLFGHDLSIIGLIGIFLLIGIVKKNAIMMIDFALGAQREEGLSPTEAIRKGALLRFRPIMMTTMGAFVGALPLAFGGGAGSELRTPLGIAIAGGLLASQTLTLYTTPVIYLWFERLREGARGTREAPVT